jgi:hypothetical protein
MITDGVFGKAEHLARRIKKSSSRLRKERAAADA